MGAYAHFGPLMPFMSRKLACGPYRVRRVDYAWTAVATNTNPVGPYRGAGQPEATNGLERTIENAARSLGLDPLELRRRNLVAAGEMPFRTPTGLTYDSGDYAAALDRAAELVGYDEVRAEQAERRRQGDRTMVGVGFATYVSVVDTSAELGHVGVGDDGRIGVHCGTFSHGQAHRTTITTVVAGVLGVEASDIDYGDGDSDALDHGAGTGGSRSAMMGGGAARLAAEVVLERARTIAARLLEADPADIVPLAGVDGAPGLGVVGVPSSTVSWEALARAATEDGGEPLEAAVDYQPDEMAHPSGTHASVVEVDTETGQVRLRRQVAVDDCGTVLNPTVVEGQQHGGVVAGVAQAPPRGDRLRRAGQPPIGDLRRLPHALGSRGAVHHHRHHGPSQPGVGHGGQGDRGERGHRRPHGGPERRGRRPGSPGGDARRPAPPPRTGVAGHPRRHVLGVPSAVAPYRPAGSRPASVVGGRR